MKLLLSLLFVFSLYSCAIKQGKEAFDWTGKEVSLIHEELVMDTILHIGANPFTIINDYIFFQILDNEHASSLFQISNDSLNHITSLLTIGRGPYEMVQLMDLCYLPKEQQLLLFGRMPTGRTYQIDLTKINNISDLSCWKEGKFLNNPGNILRIAPIDTTIYFAQTWSGNNNMFSYIDLKQDTLIELAIPYPDDLSIANETKGFAYAGQIRKNPTAPKFVYSAQYGEYVTVFDFDKNRVTNIKTLFNNLPKYEVKEGSIDFRLLTESEYGFYPTVTANQIYLRPENTTVGNIRANKNLNNYPFGFCDYILTFDWDGTPYRYYKLDVPVQIIAVDSDDQYIYATSIIDDEEKMVRFKLPK